MQHILPFVFCGIKKGFLMVIIVKPYTEFIGSLTCNYRVTSAVLKLKFSDVERKENINCVLPPQSTFPIR